MMKTKATIVSSLVFVLSVSTDAAQEPTFSPPPVESFRCYVSEKDWTDPKAAFIATLQLDKDGRHVFAMTGKPPHEGRYIAEALGKLASSYAGLFATGGSIILTEHDGRTPALNGLYVVDADGRAAFMLQNPKLPSAYLRCGEADTIRSAALSARATSTSPESKPRTTEPLPTAKLRFFTKPGQGLKPQQIVGLAQQIEYHGMTFDPMSRMWTGNHSVDDYLVLSDGSIRKGWPLMLPLEDFDAEASKSGEPELWGRYTARGKSGAESVYEVTWDKGGQETLKLSFTVPARPDERLRGFFYNIGTASTGVPGNGTFSSAWGGISFHPDGRFETASGGSSDYSGATGSVTAVNRRSAQGSYRLSGTLLELRYDDGRIDRKQFVFSSDEKNWIIVDGRRLLLRK